MGDEPIVQTADLSHRFGNRVALDKVNLAVAPGLIFALLGPNGSGKTTLFRILTTLLQPQKGMATVGGADVFAERALVRRRLGIVFQHPSLDKKLSVRENILLQGSLYGLSGPRLKSIGRELLYRFGLLDRAGDRVETLSGGLQRRVELAKCLLHRPQVVVLDEPSTGLDPGARADLMQMLRELRNEDGVTCLLTTHLMEEAEKCDRVAVFDRGRLIACDSPAILKSTLGGEVITVRAKNADHFAEAVRRRLSVGATVADGVVYIDSDKGHEFVSTLVSMFRDEIESVTVGRPTLDDVFLHLTGHRLWDGAPGKEGSHATN